MENPESLRTLFIELEPTAISREHNWRHIFAALKVEARTSTDLSRFRSVLIKYMQFLRSRKHLLDDLIESKTGLEETDVHTNVETYLALQARMRRKEREGDDGTPGPEEVVRLAETTGKICAVNYCYSAYPMVRHMAAMVRRGDLGKIRLVVANFSHGHHADAGCYGWR